nr:HigA family addiction module antitoxin [Marivita lacus]
MAKLENHSVGPLHPGHFVRKNVIDPLGLSVKDAAEALGVHRVALSRFLNEQAALSPDMAIRLHKALGANFEELMRMQNDYDIQQAKKRFGEIRVASIRKTGIGSEQQLALPLPWQFSRSCE